MTTETVIQEIHAERMRQINVEGWTTEHDDRHTDGSLASAAACYAEWHTSRPPDRWPWFRKWWKPTTRRRDIIKAAALLVAEIERLDRIELRKTATQAAVTRP